LAELIEALDDVFRFAECNQPSLDDGCSLVSHCPLRGPVAEIHERIREVLSALTLADLFKSRMAHGADSADGLLPLTLPEPCAAS
jgi:DNA-binding IscR family transcriptional regulator